MPETKNRSYDAADFNIHNVAVVYAMCAALRRLGRHCFVFARRIHKFSCRFTLLRIAMNGSTLHVS